MLSGSSILFSLLCVLTFATAVHAESAWLLWHEEVSMYPEARSLDRSWDNPVPFPDRASCMAFLANNVAEWRKKSLVTQSATLAQTGMVAEFKTTSSGGGVLRDTLYCYPDTVDPRGPKGK
jgi:hypothetical protein